MKETNENVNLLRKSDFLDNGRRMTDENRNNLDSVSCNYCGIIDISRNHISVCIWR